MARSCFSRRDFLTFGGLGAAAIALAACGAAPPTEAPKPAATSAPAQAPASSAATPAPAKPAAAAGAGPEVTFWGHNHAVRVDLDKEILDTFLKEQGNGAKVEYVVVPQEYEV